MKFLVFLLCGEIKIRSRENPLARALAESSNVLLSVSFLPSSCWLSSSSSVSWPCLLKTPPGNPFHKPGLTIFVMYTKGLHYWEKMKGRREKRLCWRSNTVLWYPNQSGLLYSSVYSLSPRQSKTKPSLVWKPNLADVHGVSIYIYIFGHFTISSDFGSTKWGSGQRYRSLCEFQTRALRTQMVVLHRRLCGDLNRTIAELRLIHRGEGGSEGGVDLIESR